MDLVELRLSPVIDGMKNAHGYALRGGCLIQMSLGKFFTLTSLDALWPAYVTPTHFDAIPKHESDPERKFRESDPSVSFDVALFGIKGNARFVYLAQSEGLGPKSTNENARPTARPFRSSEMPQLHYPALQAGLGKLLDLRPEILRIAQHQKAYTPLQTQFSALTHEPIMSEKLTDDAYAEAVTLIEECRNEKKSKLSLQNLRLTSLPPEIGQLTGLTKLLLYENQLTSLPPEIGLLPALTMLDLRGNQLTALPPEIGQLTALTRLDLSGNQLTVLPPKIGQLTALTELSLYGNQLTVLPPEIGKLTALTNLDLDENQLTSLPAEIGKLTALQRTPAPMQFGSQPFSSAIRRAI